MFGIERAEADRLVKRFAFRRRAHLDSGSLKLKLFAITSEERVERVSGIVSHVSHTWRRGLGAEIQVRARKDRVRGGQVGRTDSGGGYEKADCCAIGSDEQLTCGDRIPGSSALELAPTPHDLPRAAQGIAAQRLSGTLLPTHKHRVASDRLLLPGRLRLSRAPAAAFSGGILHLYDGRLPRLPRMVAGAKPGDPRRVRAGSSSEKTWSATVEDLRDSAVSRI